MTFTEGYNGENSGIYPDGSALVLNAGTYQITYSGTAQPSGTAQGTVTSGAAVTLGGYVFPPSADLAVHASGTTASLGRTFVVTASSPTALRVINPAQQGPGTSYTNFNLVIQRIA